MTDPGAGAPTNGDPLVAALARLVEALDERHPDGPAELLDSLAIGADMVNMPTVSDRIEPPAA
jgi:hypothetical protein